MKSAPGKSAPRKPGSGFGGSWVALPTPFRSGTIDYPALTRLIRHQIEGGSDGIVLAGSTGEGSTLSLRERLSVIEFGRRTAAGRLGVLCGVGAADTRQACELAREAENLGVDGLLASAPPYLRPTQRGLVEHFCALAAATRLPIVLYNIPGRTGVDLLPATVATVARSAPRVVAIKEAGTSLERVRELVALGLVDVLAGEDTWLPDALHAGAVGLIGVVSNLVPAQISELVREALAGDSHRAPEILETLGPLIRALTLEPNPGPLKAALEAIGLCTAEQRLPLVSIAEDTRAQLHQALTRAGLVRG